MSVEDDVKQLLEFKGCTERAVQDIDSTLKEIKNNHLVHIDSQITCIFKKLNGRPSWAVSIIITLLTTTVGILSREVIRCYLK